MKIPARLIGSSGLALFCGAFFLTACNRNAEEAPADASPTPTPEVAAEGIPAAAQSPDPDAEFAGTDNAEPIENVVAEETPDLGAENPENVAVKREVLERIDLMPNLSAEEKDRLYVRVERAQGMGKVITIPFATGDRDVPAKMVAQVQDKLTLPEIQKLIDDPTVVFIALGFADKRGDDQKNLELSLERAEASVRMLKNKAGLFNVMHAVGMGSSDLFSEEDFDKNRVVEIWAVVP